MCSGRESNPYGHFCPQDFKSCVSTYSTTRAHQHFKSGRIRHREPKKPLTAERLCRAENETRTRDPNLGKVMLYQLSYFRIWDCKSNKNFIRSKKNNQNLYYCIKLFKEPDVVFKIVAQILHLPFEHGNPLNPHSKCKSGINLAINTTGF